MTSYIGHVIEYLSGDGEKTTFPLRYPIMDRVHDRDDPFCDGGIFRSDPKVEYPHGTRRWAVSHTFLSYPITDGALYDKEYIWDVRTNTITTHFHEHVLLEPARTDASGLRVEVARRPISTGVYVRANHFTKRCTSAVRGVWDNPEKQGKNYYSRRTVILTERQMIIYFPSKHQPILNQCGVWEVDESEHPERFFDAQGICTAPDSVIEELRIPLHEPKIMAGAWKLEQTDLGHIHFEAGRALPGSVTLVNNFQPVPPPEYIGPLMGSRFVPGFVGYAAHETKDEGDRPPEYAAGVGYSGFRDINDDGQIGEWERDFLREHQGEVWRVNVGDAGYFGVGWLSPGLGSAIIAKQPYRRFVASYDYGGGYDPDAGGIDLLDSPGPNREVFVEYHYDAPAAPGENIKVHLHL